jgi:hypothetical protein
VSCSYACKKERGCLHQRPFNFLRSPSYWNVRVTNHQPHLIPLAPNLSISPLLLTHQPSRFPFQKLGCACEWFSIQPLLHTHQPSCFPFQTQDVRASVVEVVSRWDELHHLDALPLIQRQTLAMVGNVELRECMLFIV